MATAHLASRNPDRPKGARPSFALAVASVLLLALVAAVPAAAADDRPPGTAVRLADGAPPVEIHLADATPAAVEVVMGSADGRVQVEVMQQGVDVVVEVFDPDGEAVTEVDSPNGASGPELVEIGSEAVPARSGVWRLVVRPFTAGAPVGDGVVTARIAARWSAAEVAEIERRLAARRESARRWVRDHAAPLASVEAGHGFADLAPLGARVGDARVVSLGEATHGTREFFQLKHRVLEYLVAEKGFTAFVIEAALPEALDVDAWVQGGDGDPAQALSGLYFWTWDTAEVLDLVRWMRAWNADPSHTRKIHFYGNDVQFPARAVRRVADYLRRVDPEAAPSLAPGPVTDAPLAFLADPEHADELRFGSLPPADVAAVVAAADALVAQLARHRHEYSAASSPEAWGRAHRLAVVVRQFVEMATVPLAQGSARRDRAMAENTLWALGREGTDGKLVLWAHNYHVSTSTPATQGTWMRKALGDDLRIFGFAFARGGFQAVGMGSNQGEGLRDFRVEAPPVGSLDELLDEAVRERRAGGEPAAAWLVDLAALPADGPVAEWFAEPRRARSFGAGFDEARPDAFASAQVQTDAYDALLFVPATTAARANPGVSRGATEVAPAVANLGFEDDPPGAERGPGGAPAGWILGQRVNLSATATVSEDGCPEGRRCLRLSRPAGPRYGEAPARLTQRVDATAWRGRRLRLTASAHHRAGEEASAAYLGLRAHSASAGFFTRPVETEAPLADGDWATVELELDVPEDAESVEIGLSLVGAGDAWLDGVEVEDVGPVAAAGGETAAGGD